MNSNIIIKMAMPALICITIFLLYDRFHHNANTTNLYASSPTILNKPHEEASILYSANFEQKAPETSSSQTNEVWQVQQNTNQSCNHEWVNCSTCKGTGSGFFGEDGSFSYCKACRGQQNICKKCNIKDNRPKPCIACKGTNKCGFCYGLGYTYDEYVGSLSCYHCDQTGLCVCVRNNYQYIPDNYQKTIDNCYTCNGNKRCPICRGIGYRLVAGDRLDCSACAGNGVCYKCFGSGIQN